jgi:hypothetical protein
MQVLIPEANPLISPISEVAEKRRFSSCPPRRRGTPLGEPPCPPGRARVSTPAPSGQRLKTTEGRRSRLDRTALVAPYRFGSRVRLTAGPRWSAGPDSSPACAWVFPACAPAPVGLVRCWAGPAGQIWPAVYFFRNFCL